MVGLAFGRSPLYLPLLLLSSVLYLAHSEIVYLVATGRVLGSITDYVGVEGIEINGGGSINSGAEDLVDKSR